MEEPLYENVFDLRKKCEESKVGGNIRTSVCLYDSDDDSGTGSYVKGIKNFLRFKSFDFQYLLIGPET